MPGLRERKKRLKLQRIIAEARQLFVHKEFAETTIQEIAEAADVGFGTLYLTTSESSSLRPIANSLLWYGAASRTANSIQGWFWGPQSQASSRSNTTTGRATCASSFLRKNSRRACVMPCGYCCHKPADCGSCGIFSC
jgi:Bacterial regulatory proteins, tetR family